MNDLKQQLPNLVLIGIQGSGKGTQAEFLKENLGYTVIGMGDLLREEIENQSELGKKIQDVVAKGELVSDEIIDQVLRKKALNITEDGPIAFDGFPRTVKQKYILTNFFETSKKTQPYGIYLDISKDEALKRLSMRKVCVKNGHILSIPPDKVDQATCNRCGGELKQRHDDTPEIIAERFALFEKETLPLVESFKEDDRLIILNGEQEIAEVSNELEFALSNIIRNK